MNMTESKTMLLEVDIHNRPIGRVGKMEAHEQGILHRAFSVFIFNSEGKWLLQKRALTKYHSAGLWTNACCGHPSPEENVNDAASSRLQFEMGMSCELENVFDFTYKVELENGLLEHEYDQVFIGISDELPDLNVDEADEFCYLDFDKLKSEVDRNPNDFTHWFKLIFERVQDIYLLNFQA